MNTAGRLTAQFAVLVDRFHLTVPQIMKLTPRQIDEIYFHPRDQKTGELIPPKPEAKFGKSVSGESAEQAALMFASQFVSPEKLQAVMAKVKATREKTGDNGPTARPDPAG